MRFFKSSWTTTIVLVVSTVNFVFDKVNDNSKLLMVDAFIMISIIAILIYEQNNDPNPWLLKSKKHLEKKDDDGDW